jgi:hypothetical protein
VFTNNKKLKEWDMQKEKAIIFNTEMVKAILDGCKVEVVPF